MNLNAETAGWSRRYQTALRRHLKQGLAASLQPALRLGLQASALGLETLDVARFHKQALTSLVSPDGTEAARQGMIRQAKSFFKEALVPIEKTHAAALKADLHVKQLTQKLHRRTQESSASTQKLESSIVQRQKAEAALKKSERTHSRLLNESGALQSRLRHQTRTILSAQERERQTTSRHLQDEIAQTLLAINIRLSALKTATQSSTEKLEKEISTTQRLVSDSVKRINRCAHEYAIKHKKTCGNAASSAV